MSLLAPGDLATTLRAAAEPELWRPDSPLLPGFGHSLRLSLAVTLGALVLWLPLGLIGARYRSTARRVLAACERLGVRRGGLPLLLVAVVGLGRTGAFLNAQRALFPFAAAQGARDQGFWALALVYLSVLLPLAGLGLGAALERHRRHRPTAGRSAVAVDHAPALLAVALLIFSAATLAQLASCQPELCVYDHTPALLVDAYRIDDVPLSPILGHALAVLLAPTAAVTLLLSGWCYVADEGWKQRVTRRVARQGLRLLRWLSWLLRK